MPFHVLRQQIRNYYGDPLGTGTFGVDSNYAKEAQAVAKDGKRSLDKRYRGHKTKAILLDVDDTSLATWNYEIASNWAYNPATNGTFVTEQRFPAVPGMVDLVKKAEREGYAVFFLTGRGAAQEPARTACSPSRPWPSTPTTSSRLARTTRTAAAPRSTTSRPPARISSHSGTTSSRTSATSSAT